MKHYSELEDTVASLEFETIRTNKKITYINLACGFDIETTSHKFGETKVAFSYIWMIGIGHKKGVFYGREWSDFLYVCELLQKHFDLDENRRLVIYIHNLGYEFQFMRRFFEWVDVFSIDERKPLKALCSYGIEFRDSYLLSGYSLANTAKNLTNSDVKKLEGDLDYSLIRTPKTPLTDDEMNYCKNDIEIITAYITEQIEMYSDISKIPMTNTGRVRTYVRHECYYTNKNHRKSSEGKFKRYRKIMRDLTLTSGVYKQLKRSFMGGFTHANANYSGKIIENVASIDFTSSYPAVMCSEKFPMSRFKPVRILNEEMLQEYCDTYAMVFDIRFTNLKCKLTQETYISESKCFELVEPIINNGRVVSASLMATTITETDLEIMRQVYEWDKIEISDAKYAHKNYLPKAIIKSILDLYQGKTELKDVEGSEVEYMLSKGMLNSIYGMSVTDVVMDKTTYVDDWGKELANIGDEIAKYNDSVSRFLYYPWGIWVTAYARRNLWTGIIATGSDYVYSDTDSLKIINYENHSNYIEWFNSNIIDKMEAMCDFYKFDKKLLYPKTKEGIEKPLGIWDFEGIYTRFKTLGAKRYLTQMGDKISLTCAGLSKQNGIEYMKEKSIDIEGVFHMFNDDLYIPADRTGKMTHTYIDEESEFEIVDYLGERDYIKVPSGIHLEPCEFTLSISEQYAKFIRNLANGYMYKGVKLT